MRRPSFGPRIIRGLYLIWRKMLINIENGYIPHYWTTTDLQDAKRALRYIGLLVDWGRWTEAERKKKEEEDAAAETNVA